MTDQTEVQERLERLEAKGHGECLEAIRLRGGDHAELRAYMERLENNGGTNTLSYRRAARLLGR